MSGDSVKPHSELDHTPTTERTRFSRLLLVDDNESLLVTLSGMLEDEGFVVTSCRSASEAVQRIGQNALGLAIIDLRLPDMRGTPLSSVFKQLGSKVWVIINTAYRAFESAKDAFHLGAFARNPRIYKHVRIGLQYVITQLPPLGGWQSVVRRKPPTSRYLSGPIHV